MTAKTIIPAILSLVFLFGFAACKENKAPAKKIIGTYKGSFTGNWQGNDTLVQTPGFTVTVSEISDNKVRLEGTLFYAFEVLVTNAGINVEPVSDEPELPHFLYSGDSDELDFDYIDADNNTASFTGIKQ